MRNNIFRDGMVHVCAEMCSTCIFRPGNLMSLQRGRVKGMVQEATSKGGAIVCHQTLDTDNAACRGFFDKHPTPLLQIAQRLGHIKEVDTYV